jgi:predicted component of type VI protein secretion system
MPLVLVDFSGRTVASMPPAGRLVVGRAVECDVTLTDPTISRRHAELRNGGDAGAMFVRDLGSRNGTFRNGKRIDVAELHAGDSVTFGAVTLRVAQLSPAVEMAVPSGRPSGPPPGDADAAAWYAAAAAQQARSAAYAEPPSDARGIASYEPALDAPAGAALDGDAEAAEPVVDAAPAAEPASEPDPARDPDPARESEPIAAEPVAAEPVAAEPVATEPENASAR